MSFWWLTADTKSNVKCGTSESIYEFRGNSRKDNWKEPIIECTGLRYKPKDFVSFSSSTVFLVSERVAEFFKSSFSDSVELLSVPEICDKKYFLVNVIRLIGGCINFNCSNLDRSDNGQIYNEDGVEFIDGCIKTPQIFKISECPGKVFINYEFRNLLENNKFSGMLYYEPTTRLRDLFYGSAVYERPNYKQGRQ